MRTVVVLVAALFGAALVGAQPVVGNVSSVGFRASTTNGTGLVVRAGQWMPIQAQLMVQGSQLFQGRLRFESTDLDGDLVSYVETPVTVTPDAGLKRAWCYAVWLPSNTGQSPTLDIVSDEGVLINRLPVPAFETVGSDTLVILDASSRPLTKLRGLETPRWSLNDPAYGNRRYYANVLVANLPAAELPDRWIGLEAANVVVWDEPNPAGVSIAQLQALIQWVRNGGQLVVGLGSAWTAVEKSELAEIIPLRPHGSATTAGTPTQPPTIEVQELEQFFERLVDGTYQSEKRAGQRSFRAPISVAVAEAKPGALRAFRTRVRGGPVVDLFAAQWVGSGRVIACAARLSDLLAVPVNDAFYAHLFDLNPTTEKFRKHESESWQFAAGLQPHKLYNNIIAEVSSKGAASLLVLAAFAFVVAYIGLATLASWGWLKRHRLVVWSWTVFAVFAILASALSLATVGVRHAVSRGVDEFSLLDLEAGSRTARAKCHFGYSSPARQSIELSLPGEGTFLRALARGPEGSGSYATPLRYAAQSGKGLLEGVQMRATLKQFEGFWQGELNGNVRAELVIDRATGEITPGSWIQNDLDVDFVGGYLLCIDPRVKDSDHTRAAGRTTNWWGRQDVPPALNVLAVWLPELGAGQKLSGIGQEYYRAIRAEREKWAQQLNRKPEEMPDLPTLWHVQQLWVGARAEPFGMPQHGLDPTARDALLASTRAFYLHCRDDFENVNNFPITTEGLMDADVSGWLMQGPWNDPPIGQGVLLLLADDPGPARLHGNGRPLGPVRGRSLYRVRVPLALENSPPAPPVSGAADGGTQP